MPKSTCTWWDQSTWLIGLGQASSLKLSSLRASPHVRPKSAPEHTPSTNSVADGQVRSCEWASSFLFSYLKEAFTQTSESTHYSLNACPGLNVMFTHHRHRWSTTQDPAQEQQQSIFDCRSGLFCSLRLLDTVFIYQLESNFSLKLFWRLHGYFTLWSKSVLVTKCFMLLKFKLKNKSLCRECHKHQINSNSQELNNI